MPDWPPLHDYSRSRAVLIGTWDYLYLPQVPAAGNSLDRMASLLTGPLCGWPSDRTVLVANEPNPANLPDLLVTIFQDVTDVALFYYVGHGQVDQDDELCLGLQGSRTEPMRRATTSLPFSAIRRALLNSPAAYKIVILDCCFAGLALQANTLAGTTDILLDRVGVTGAYTLAGSGPYGTAWFEDSSDISRPQTYFTKYFVDLLEAGIPGGPPELPMHQVFLRLRENLARDKRPIPVERSVDVGRDYVFARNAASSEFVREASGPLVREASGPLSIGRLLSGVRSDAPSVDDLIGAISDVETLADLIAAAETSLPLTIALIGEWGAGKSSVMLQVQRRIDVLTSLSRARPGSTAFVSGVLSVRFNAWDYSDQQVWSGLVEHLFRALATELEGLI